MNTSVNRENQVEIPREKEAMEAPPMENSSNGNGAAKMQAPSFDRRRRNQKHHATNRDGHKPPEPPMRLSPDQVHFRLLCHNETIGGVIGTRGTIVKKLEAETGVTIRVENAVPNCVERVINVIGSTNVDRTIRFELGGGFGEECQVSQAQQCLVRVFERILKLEKPGDGVIGCRLLAEASRIGGIMGKGGRTISQIRKISGAKIKILKLDQLPPCAPSFTELIQIMGDILAVKKGLLAVSSRLQDCPMERPLADMFTLRVYPDPHAELHPHYTPLLPVPGNYVDFDLIGHPLSTDINRIPGPNNGSTRCKVIFRLLCSISLAGRVIGKGATKLKALEKETGASINFSAPIAGSIERIATVSALEDPHLPYSPSQIAVVRVFAKSIEIPPSILNEDISSARLLVASNQVHCLVGEQRRVASDISTKYDVDIQIIKGYLVSDCVAESDEVVQIMGGYENVKGALVEVTCRLRDNLFSSMVLDGAGSRHNFYSSVRDMNACGSAKENNSHELDCTSSHSGFGHDQTPGMDQLELPGDLDGPPSPRFTPSEIMNRANKSIRMENGKNSKASGGRLEKESLCSTASAAEAELNNKTVELVVSKDVFWRIYGEEGRTLALVKQVSGAKVMLQNPGREESEGKVTISGTPDQIVVVRSLLQAFITT